MNLPNDTWKLILDALAEMGQLHLAGGQKHVAQHDVAIPETYARGGTNGSRSKQIERSKPALTTRTYNGRRSSSEL